MRYLTIITRSKRVAIISSIIIRIFFNSVQCLDGHISTCFNKDTCDLFMLCIMLICQLYRVDLLLLFNFFVVVRLLFEFCSSFVQLLFSFDSFTFLCSLFVEKRFNSDLGLYSRYFDPAVPLYKNHHHHLRKSINIIHQTAPTLS
jgi:hypothetical protein